VPNLLIYWFGALFIFCQKLNISGAMRTTRLKTRAGIRTDAETAEAESREWYIGSST
jgi:hypothetical protein